MSGNFAAHLLASHANYQRSLCAPFGQPVNPSNFVISGPTSYEPQMHGTFPSQPSFTDSKFLGDISEDTAVKIAELQSKLNKKLGPEYISQRPGPGGGPKLTYAEGWKIINLANEVFGFNGWSSSIVSISIDFVDYSEDSKRYSVGASAIVKVVLRDGVFHEDVGYGSLENSRSKGAALDKCKKEAVTDALKRALRNFGNLMGNCLYDKHYTQEIVKIKVPQARFDQSDLHRRPEFDASISNANISSTSSRQTGQISVITSNTSNMKTDMPVKTELGPVNQMQRHATVAQPNGAGTLMNRHATMVPQSNAASSRSSGLGLSAPMQQSAQPRPNVASASNNASMGQSVTSVSGSNVARQDPGLQAHQNQLTGPDARNKLVDDRQNAGPASAKPQQQQQPGNVNNGPQQKHYTMNSRMAQSSKSVGYTHNSRNTGEFPHESFALNSDDDAFFAQLDLGEGEADLGRPIDDDEGIGGAIYFDEGLNGWDAELDGDVNVHANAGPMNHSGFQNQPRPNGNMNAVSFPQRQRVQPQAQQNNLSNHTRFAPNQANSSGSSKSVATSTTTTTTSVSPPANMPNYPQTAAARNIPPKQNMGQAQNPQMKTSMIERPKENQPATFAPPSTQARRAPSMGAFHFPPGMQTNNNLQSGDVNSNSGNVIVRDVQKNAGMKRGMDHLNNVSNADAKSLAQRGPAPTNNQAMTRQPFAPLEIDGNNVKRQRR